ncbi:MAG: hypothetical protein ACE3L7_14425 [Candidatus Pristimantibacillus sp.]
MYLFYDPSIKPIATTDQKGEVLYVRTYGLPLYGYPDIIMENDFEQYESIFYSILDKIFKLEFDLQELWVFNGKLFRLTIGQDGLARFSYPELTEINIITILNPVTGLPYKYISKGLSEIYNFPETEIKGNTLYGKEILSFFISQLEAGVTYDENSFIEYEGLRYDIHYISNRFGKLIAEITLLEDTIISSPERRTSIIQYRNLKRIK